MTPDGWAQLIQWLLGGLCCGVVLLIGVIVKLTITVQSLTSTLNHVDRRLSELKHDAEKNGEAVWEKLGEQDKAIGDLDRRVTRWEAKTT